jgi:mycothiol system anti-sigma-R factor
MSIPDQSKMKQNCANQKDCMQMLQLIVDDEATPEQKEHFLKHHLDECLPCYKNYHLEVEIRQLLKKKCCGGEAPSDIIDAIKARIAPNITHT